MRNIRLARAAALAAIVAAPPAFADENLITVEGGVIRVVAEDDEDGEFMLANPRHVVAVRVTEWGGGGGRIYVYLSNGRSFDAKVDSLDDTKALANQITELMR